MYDILVHSSLVLDLPPIATALARPPARLSRWQKHASRLRQILAETDCELVAENTPLGDQLVDVLQQLDGLSGLMFLLFMKLFFNIFRYNYNYCLNYFFMIYVHNLPFLAWIIRGTPVQQMVKPFRWTLGPHKSVITELGCGKHVFLSFSFSFLKLINLRIIFLRNLL